MSFHINMPTEAKFILQELNRNGNEIMKTFPNNEIIPTGLKHGTVTILINNMPFEITTYRIDGEYSDGRRPDEVKFTTDIVEDLKRRDFTINAIAYNPNKGFVDPFNGVEDINKKIIRCVGNPNDRFNEDGLRIMRGIRFAAQLGFDIEKETSKAIHENKSLLDKISKERIQSELCKILNSYHCGNNVLREYSDIVCQIIPEIESMIGFEQNNPYHDYDVWEHTLHCMNCLYDTKEELNLWEETTNNISLRLAVLLHDIGKPSCYSIDEIGVGHFYGHADKSAKIAYGILTNLKFSNEIINDTIQLITHHDTQFISNRKIVKRLLNKLGEKQLKRLFVLRRCDITGQSYWHYAERLLSINEMWSLLNDILNEDECYKLKNLAVNGNDLIEHGIPEGQLIGAILNFLLDKVINNEIKNDKEVLLKEVDKYVKTQSNHSA